jgi:hypothetical protein
MISTENLFGLKQNYLQPLAYIVFYLQTRRIKQIQCGGWRKGNVLPDSPDTILSLLETVRAWQQQTGNHKILVHCM